MIGIGRGKINSDQKIECSNEIFRIAKNEAIYQLKNRGFIFRDKEFFPLIDVVLYSVYNDEETFEVLFQEEIIPKSIPDPYHTLLSLACIKAKYKNVKLLLERGDDMTRHSQVIIYNLFRVYNYDINLHWEVVSILHLLFSHNINLTSQTPDKYNILYYIILYTRESSYELEFLREILMEAFKKGTDYLKKLINAQNLEGYTALILAAEKEKLLIVKELLKWEPDETIIDKKGKTFLDYLTPENKRKVGMFSESLRISRMRNKKGISRKEK